MALSDDEYVAVGADPVVEPPVVGANPMDFEVGFDLENWLEVIFYLIP